MRQSMQTRILAFLVLGALGAGTLAMSSCRHQSLGLRDEATRMPDVYFPTITAENLNKEKVTLPDDLAGKPALVLVAYQRQQQSNVDTWLGQMDAIEAAIPGVRIIETPTISSMKWGWFAGFIDGGMRSGIPDPEARARTITLYTDVGKFNRAVGIESTKTIYALLLDEQGRVVEMVEGDYSDAKLAQLIDAM
jgi:hypothetical protein